MRIACVCPRYPPLIGGVETYAHEIMRRLPAMGCEVEVFTQVAGGRPSVELEDGVTVRRFAVRASREGRALSPRLWQALRARRAGWDVVHAHDYHALPALGGALCGAPAFVLTSLYHGRGHSAASRLRNLAYRPAGSLVLRRAARVICLSHAEADLLRADFPAVAERIDVIPAGLRSASKAPSGQRPEGRATILSLGRLEAYKNVDAVVRALAELPAPLALRVIGGGPAAKPLRDLAARLGVAPRVELAGQVDGNEVDRALEQSSVLVTMSSRETFGLAPLEALGSGLRVVASDIPAHRELKDSYGAGLIELVALDAPPAVLARAIERAATAGRAEPAPNLPSWDLAAERTFDVYRRVARRR